MLDLFFDAVIATVGIICGVYVALTVLVGAMWAVMILLAIIISYTRKLYVRAKNW